MKEYIKPEIKSEQVFEKTALLCSDYAYYDKDANPCYDEYIGLGKQTTACAALYS